MIDPESNRFLVTHADGATGLYAHTGVLLRIVSAEGAALLAARGLTHARLRVETPQVVFVHAENMAIEAATRAAFEATRRRAGAS